MDKVNCKLLYQRILEEVNELGNFSEEQRRLIQQIIQNVMEGPWQHVSLEEINQKMQELHEKHSFRNKKMIYFSQLTQRETEVLAKLAMGHTNKELADQLFISVDTVKYHRKHIKSKLEASSTADFIKYAEAFNLMV